MTIGRCTCGMHPLDDVDRAGINEANGAGRTELIAQTYDSAEGRYEFSGNQDVDAALIGSRWTIRSFTYSFPSSGAFYAGQGYDAGSEPSQHSPFNAQQQQAVRYAYSLISSYTGLVFTEVTETATTHADFRFSRSSHAEKVPTAYANFPSSSAKAGDVWFGTTGQPFYDTPALGNWGMATMMHEMGHTMGLKHGHSDYTTINLADGNIDAPAGGGPRYGSKDLPTNHDGQAWSLMTYRPDPTDLGPGEETQMEADGFNQPQTYMQNDIAALQYLYGANFAHNSGNTTYSWSAATGTLSVNGVARGAPTSNKILMTLWDGNGNDTYDLSNYATDLQVNLQPGAFSTFSETQLVNHQAQSGYAPAVGNVANALLYRGDRRSLIENAIGGSGDDQLVGNVAANELRGGAAAGADLLVGDAGNDALYGEAGADTLYGDSRPGVPSTIGFGTGAFNKEYGYGNWSMANAVDVTGMFTLDPNGNVAASFLTPHVTINALSGDSLDYYKVTLGAGATVTLDIDNGLQCDTMIFLLDAGGNVVAFNDDSALTDGAEGSLQTQDSFLRHTVAQGGTYYIAVGEHYSDTQAQPLQTYSWYELQISVAAQQTLGGGTGNDLLDGGAGADRMVGGNGNDTYVIDVAGDRLFEAANGGIDTVRSAISYSLSAQLEHLALTGNAAINGTGNALANNLTGNAAANSLTGGGGNDRLSGAAGVDTMRGGAGDDSYWIDNVGDKAIEAAAAGTDTVNSAISITLAVNLENLVLTGNAVRGLGNNLGNTLTGNAQANALDGRAGADVMRGGAGDDSYAVDNLGDKVLEGLAAGVDLVTSSVSFVLSLNVENLTLAGSAALDGIGNAVDNLLRGNGGANGLAGGAGADRLVAGGGNDTLNGGGGNDILGGGTGADDFEFDKGLSANVDRILDFSAADDTIRLDRAVFSAIAADGALSTAAFRTGTAAGDANDRIVYDKAAGKLFYDADGSGAGDAILFAQLSPGTALTHLDIVAYTG